MRSFRSETLFKGLQAGPFRVWVLLHYSSLAARLVVLEAAGDGGSLLTGRPAWSSADVPVTYTELTHLPLSALLASVLPVGSHMKPVL